MLVSSSRRMVTSSVWNGRTRLCRWNGLLVWRTLIVWQFCPMTKSYSTVVRKDPCTIQHPIRRDPFCAPTPNVNASCRLLAVKTLSFIIRKSTAYRHLAWRHRRSVSTLTNQERRLKRWCWGLDMMVVIGFRNYYSESSIFLYRPQPPANLDHHHLWHTDCAPIFWTFLN